MAKNKGHVHWDEAALEEHRKAAGVLYGTMKINECPSPYLYYSESLSREDLTSVGEFQKDVGKVRVGVEDLQERLGLLSMIQDQGKELRPEAPYTEPPSAPPPWVILISRSEPGEHFYYNPETNMAQWDTPAADEGEEPAVEAVLPAAEPVPPAAPPASPPAAPEPDVPEPAVPDPAATSDDAMAASSATRDEDDEDDVPMPQSKIAMAMDCGDLYVKQKLGGINPAHMK